MRDPHTPKYVFDFLNNETKTKILDLIDELYTIWERDYTICSSIRNEVILDGKHIHVHDGAVLQFRSKFFA